MGDEEKSPSRASVTADQLEEARRKLSEGSTKEASPMAKEKPDEMDLVGAKKRLSNVSTVEKNQLPSAEDIQKEEGGEVRAAAEAALQEGRGSLKPVETEVKQRLPSETDINAERSADVMAGEILTEAKRKLSSTSTEEKQALPTPDDIKAEKKDKSCAVIGSEQMSKAAISKAKAEAAGKSLGTVDKRSLAVGGAGAGGGFGLNAPGYGVKVQSFAGGGEGKKKQVNVSPEITSAWASVLDDEAKTAWIYCSYSDDLKNLNLQASGEGGLSEFKQQIGETMAWGGFRCYGVDKRGSTVVRRTKFVFVQVRPETVSMIKRAKQTSHKADVKDAITGAHLDIAVESLADLDSQSLITKLQAATGAHKPNGYEFDGEFIEADFYGLGIGKQCKGETASAN